MAIPAFVITLGSSLAGAIAKKSVSEATDAVVVQAKERLAKRLGKGECNPVLQRALGAARDEVFNQCQTHNQRRVVGKVLDTLMYSESEALLKEFSAQITQIYLLPTSDAPSAQAMARTYRKFSGPVAVLEGKVPDEAVLTDLLDAFFLAFRERLLREPDFTHLREYSGFTQEREQTILLQSILGRLDVIVAANVPLEEDFAEVRQEYYDYLINDLKDHTIRGFAPQVSGEVLSLPISEIFLPLQAVEGRPALAEYAEQDLLRQAASEVAGELDWLRRREEMEKRYAQLSARRAAERPLSLADLLKESRSVLLGDPGTGKTTTTRYITYALAADDITHIGIGARGRNPVLIRIANYANAYERDKTLHLIEYIEEELTPKLEFGRYLRRAIEEGQCLIILDGLDEVANPNLRIQITDRIQNMVALFSDNHFIVTSRIVGYDRSPLTREFKHATLKDLTEEDRERFVRLWYGAIKSAIGGSARAEGAGNLIQALRDKPQIARMAANPLLLTIIVLMHWRGVKLPSRRVQVYQNATDTLVEYWTAQREVAELDAEEIKAILAPIAYYILSSNVSGVISRQDLLPRFYKGIAEQRGCDKAEARRIGKELLENLSEQSGLFLERGLDADGQPVYGFLHQTFGEYLAGLCMAEDMQSGEFVLETHIHRSMWHEPLLLMAGHLSIYSKPQANVLIRDILSYDTPYEDVLQRNLLLAADCLADDIYVQPRLRNEVLRRLAGLLQHDAPQVCGAALERYRRMAMTRHCEAAVAALKRAYPLDAPDNLEAPVGTRLNLATAFLNLKERDLAQPILWPLESHRDYAINRKVQGLRFEHWPEQAADYLLQLQADPNYDFSIRVGSDLGRSTLGPVSARLARRVLGETGLCALLETLVSRVKDEEERVALRWLAILTPGTPSTDALFSLTTPDVSARVRRLAATHLLESGHRADTITVLRDLAESEASEAPAAAQALLEAGEAAHVDWQLLRDTALMAHDDNAPDAIAALLQIGDEAIALPAALHFLANARRGHYLWSVVENLIEHDHIGVGLAAASWLALRPGYQYRLKACEALLEAGRVEQTIPLLQYLAYECHDDASQRACERLLMLKESQRVASLLTRIAHSVAPSLCYQACLALALVGQALPCDDDAPGRTELKVSILDERTRAYQMALSDFCQVGLEVLDALDPMGEQARSSQVLGRLSLKWLAQPFNPREREDDLNALADDPWPAINVNVALFDLRAGRVDRVQKRLVALLTQADQLLPLPVRRQALATLGQITGPETTERLIQALRDQASAVRQLAARALGELGDPEAVQPLITALNDKDSGVRNSVAIALGWLGVTETMQPLIAALSDEDSGVRSSAVNALGRLGDLAAVQTLIAALSDENGRVRSSAANALGELGDLAAVQPLIAALDDENSVVRWSAVYALRRLKRTKAVQFLVAALNDEDSYVRDSAATALGWIEATEAIPLLVAALSDADSRVRMSAARALGEMKKPEAVQPLVVALNSESSRVRCSVVIALGWLGELDAVQPLITALGDEDNVVRSSAAEALGWLGAAEAVQPLAAALNDENIRVRWLAAKALGRLEKLTALQSLISALSDTSSVVRGYAAEALGKLGEPKAVHSLIAVLSDEDGWMRSFVAEALGRLGVMEAVPMIVATSATSYSWGAQRFTQALIHLDPDRALLVLDRYEWQFRKENWVTRLRGQALWRLGEVDAALASLRDAVKKKDDSTNLLALAHFYLERADLQTAEEHVNRVLKKAPRRALCLLSQAALLWEMGQATEALEKLRQARRRERRIAHVKDLQYEHLWGPKALAAVEAMLAESVTREG